MLFKNTASQKVRVFAFDATTGLPKTGDAANITGYVTKDFGSVTALTDTSATEEDSTNAKGYYLIDISQSETNADDILISAKSSTSNIVVVGAPARIATRPPNAGALSIDSSGRVDVIKVAGTTQTARDLGASVLLSSGTGTGQLDFTSGVVKSNLVQMGGTAQSATDLKDFADTGYDPSTHLAAADLQTIKTQTVTCAGGVTVPAATLASTTNITAAAGCAVSSIGANVITAASIANGAIDAATFAADVDAEILSYLVDDATRIDASQLNTHTAITAAGIADAVWDEAQAGHTTPDTFGEYLDAAVSGVSTGGVSAADIADAVWDEATSGHATAGTFGKAAADILDDTGTAGVIVASLANNSVTAAALAADAGTEIGTAVWATTTRLLTAGTNIVLAKGTGVTGFNDLSAAQVNAEVDTALADVGLTTTVTGRIDAAITTRQATFTAATSLSFPTNFAALSITAGGVVSADVKAVNATTLTGTGVLGDEWGPA